MRGFVKTVTAISGYLNVIAGISLILLMSADDRRCRFAGVQQADCGRL